MAEPLSPVDAAWLRMDRVTNRMVITGVLLFDDVIARAELVRLLAERLPEQRFRERVVDRGGLRRPFFAKTPVDFDAHVVVTPWPAPYDERALERIVAESAAAPFDRARPLWSAQLVVARDKCALVFRAHHCLADGLALVAVLLALSDERAGEVAAVGRVRARGGSVLRRAVRFVVEALTLAKLVALPPDPRAWKKPLAVAKSMAWTRPLPFDDVKRTAHDTGAHVTDVLLADVAGAMRSAVVDARPVRALVPLFFRTTTATLGNRFGLIYVPLPLDEPDRLARVRRLQRRTARLKRGADAAVALEVLGGFGRVSRKLEEAGVAVFSSKASAMITSVPGPKQALHVLGRELVDIVAFGPAAGSIGLTAGLFSYRGHVRVAFAVDTGLHVDARALADGYESACAEH